MRKITKTLLITLAIVLTAKTFLATQSGEIPLDGLVKNIFYIRPCDTVITYRLDKIDPAFNLSKDNAQKYIQDSTDVWGKLYGKPIFQEDPKGQLAISFIYDERQELKNQLDQQETSLDSAKGSLESKIANYEAKLADYKRRAATLEKEIKSWNSLGGAPKDTYNELTNQVKALNEQAGTLNKEAEKLNKEAESYGKSVETLNDTVTNYNSLLDTKPEEGLFDPNTQTISIYLIGSPEELTSTLAHEFGHALGMEHVSNDKAIMYAYANSNLEPTVEDRTEIAKVCQEQSRYELWKKVIQQQLNGLFFQFLRN